MVLAVAVFSLNTLMCHRAAVKRAPLTVRDLFLAVLPMPVDVLPVYPTRSVDVSSRGVQGVLRQ